MFIEQFRFYIWSVINYVVTIQFLLRNASVGYKSFRFAYRRRPTIPTQSLTSEKATNVQPRDWCDHLAKCIYHPDCQIVPRINHSTLYQFFAKNTNGFFNHQLRKCRAGGFVNTFAAHIVVDIKCIYRFYSASKMLQICASLNARHFNLRNCQACNKDSSLNYSMV